MAEPRWINNRYQIVSRLGSGGSSRVYSARDRKDADQSLVAIKLLGLLPDRDCELHRQLYSREVQALSMLSHPRIVRLLDYGEDEETKLLYLVLEYIDQATPLRDRIRVWKPDPLQCIDFLLDLLPGVAYAHESKVIHRDLNPNNILISGNGEAKIIDFGISKILGNIQRGQTVGDLYTRSYACPEQIEGRDVTNSSDIYSLAALLYFMLTREDPDHTRNLTDQFDALVGIPEPILSVARNMAATSPEKRCPTVHKATLALENARGEIESESQVLHLVLTRNITRGLYDQTVMRTQDPGEAADIVQQALDSGAFIVRDDEQEEGYLVIAESLSLRCVLGNKEGSRESDHFIAISVRANASPHKVEEWRQAGYRVNAQWRVLSVGDPLPSQMEPVSGLLDEIDDFFDRKVTERRRRERRLDLVETWRNILDLDREIKSQSTKQAEFVSLAMTSEDAVLRARLAREMPDDALFADGQLLTVSSPGSNRFRTVGHYLCQEEGCILISKLPGVRLEALPSAGILSVDERQWAAAWSRQHSALNVVVDAKCANASLPDLLLDPKQARYQSPEPIPRFFNDDLDQPKREAVEAALSAQDLYLIQGPPGTGKTVLISEIIAQTLDRDPDASVLLVSQSNVAIDHALQAVARLLPNVRMVRVGREELIAHGAEDYIVDHQVDEWAATIRQAAEPYLATHRSMSPERDDLEYARVLVEEARSVLQGENPRESSDLEAALSILREQFPGLSIKPTLKSLDELDVEIRQRISIHKGELERVLEAWIDRVGKLDDFEDAFLGASSVIAGTCVGIAGKRNLPDRFDLAIIDEAGRATPSEILIPMVRAKRSILVGDHKQLPPVIDPEVRRAASQQIDIDPIWLQRSLFEYLFNHLADQLRTTLRVQYRMHPHIARLVSQVFYPGEGLETGIRADDRSHGWNRWRTAVVWYSTSQSENRYEEVDENRSRYNLYEASIIEDQLQQLDKDLRNRKVSKSVAVIAGYRAQAEHLRNRLDPQDRGRWKSLSIEVDTVDAFQGREQDIVFYSVVRSNPRREIGFLSETRRLNVALSRARELLFIVGDHRMLARATDLRSPNPFVGVIAHIVGHPNECTMEGAPDDTR